MIEVGDFPASKAAAISEIRETGFWFQVFVNPPAQLSQPHRHHYDARLYVVSGTAKLTDTSGGITHVLGPGKKVSIPRGEEHFETIEGPVTVVYATSDDPVEGYQMQH